MRRCRLLLACTLMPPVQPFAAPIRRVRAVLRASDAEDIDADAARIAEMRKRMEGMFSGAEAPAAPAVKDASAPDTTESPAAAPPVADTPRPSVGAKPPRLGRATQRWTPPTRKSVTKAQDAVPFQRREVRGGRDVVQPRQRDDNIPGVVNFASNPRTFATGGAIVALSFVLYASVFLTGGINNGAARYAGDPEIMGEFFSADVDDRPPPTERVWI